jgi:hypothetical protein
MEDHTYQSHPDLGYNSVSKPLTLIKQEAGEFYRSVHAAAA